MPNQQLRQRKKKKGEKTDRRRERKGREEEEEEVEAGRDEAAVGRGGMNSGNSRGKAREERRRGKNLSRRFICISHFARTPRAGTSTARYRQCQ